MTTKIYGLTHTDSIPEGATRLYGDEDKPKLNDDYLAHFGVKGMRWGFRKKQPAPTYETTVDPVKLGSPIKNMDKTLHTSTQDGAHQVAAMLKSRYGYEVTSVVAIEDKRKFKNYIAYVEAGAATGNSKSKGTIHIQPRDLNPDMQKLEKSGWFGDGAGNVRSLMTHETAHSMFHAEEVTVSTGRFTVKTTGGNKEARDKAFDAAVKTAAADGIKSKNLSKNISGYAHAAYWREESEAEMFSQYHWSPNPPRFIKTWGETLHREMGIDATPFREVVDK